MTLPKIHALGITQEGAPTRSKATGYIEGIGWLTARGKSLINAMEALQALATERVAEAVLALMPPSPQGQDTSRHDAVCGGA
jgi:hypothetical protein